MPFGAIVLTYFPFTDLSGSKRRPALVVSKTKNKQTDIIVAYITSIPRTDVFSVPIFPNPDNGLKFPSLVRFDKLATLETNVVAGRLGDADLAWLSANRHVFFSVFGFDSLCPE
ncbi:MAG: type II toxin-antitoxin system PemK/MazF family toxin [Alphaproteobacteria bacterium]|nr:type II toxin-antitoxin system PemK/MazF family toxin [Alphaproteobacteria bacterium]